MNICLFCKKSDEQFTAPEHIISESLGNKDRILLPGIVCDRCNHGELAVLDQFLVEFQPIAMQRVLNDVRNKKGEFAVAKWSNMKLVRDSESHISVHLDKSTSKHITMHENKFTLKASGKFIKTSDFVILYRALCKIALGLIYLDHGKEVALSKRFDNTRKIVLGEVTPKGRIVTTNAPIDDKKLLKEARVKYMFDKSGEKPSAFVFSFFGIIFFYSPEEPLIKIPQEILATGLLKEIDF